MAATRSLLPTIPPKQVMFARLFFRRIIAILFLHGLLSSHINAAVLPEDRADILYHRYEGGGSSIDGPSIIARKKFAESVSLWGNYYADVLSSASIDVITQGSAYTEKRTQLSAGIDYVHDRTFLSASITNSSENDYEANALGLGLSQEFFGDLTTLSINYAQGNDDVKQNIRENGVIVGSSIKGDARHQRFGLGLTQVITKTFLLAANIESVIDDGYLNNPYRSVRYLSGDQALPEAEIYPTTRNSDAFSIKGIYYLPYRASLRLEARTYRDSWGIKANNAEIRYIHPFGKKWIVEAKFRTYAQTQANFYSDLFSRANSQNFLARDKELSTFSDSTIGLGASYEIHRRFFNWIDKVSLNFYFDHMSFNYDNFRENTAENTELYGVGNEPLYQFDANVVRLFISVWY